MGAEHEGSDGLHAGAAYLFHECGGSWIQLEKYLDKVGGAGSSLGRVVSLSDQWSFLSAPFEISGGLGELGAVHVFDTATIWEPGGLHLDNSSAPVSGPIRVEMALCAGAEHAGRTYWILGSLSGTAPGFSFAGNHVALNPDVYFDITLSTPNQGPLLDSLGTLDPNGIAYAAFDLPAPTPLMANLTLNHLYAVFDLQTLVVEYFTAPATLQLTND